MSIVCVHVLLRLHSFILAETMLIFPEERWDCASHLDLAYDASSCDNA